MKRTQGVPEFSLDELRVICAALEEQIEGLDACLSDPDIDVVAKIRIKEQSTYFDSALNKVNLMISRIYHG